MSNFKKMKLVRDEKESANVNNFHLSNGNRHKISPNLKQLNNLDIEINEILNSNINESSKAKLYTQALRKFLTFKKLHQEDEAIHRNREIEKLKLTQPKFKNAIIIRKPTRRKKIPNPTPQAPKKNKTFISRTKNITHDLNQPSTSSNQNITIAKKKPDTNQLYKSAAYKKEILENLEYFKEQYNKLLSKGKKKVDSSDKFEEIQQNLNYYTDEYNKVLAEDQLSDQYFSQTSDDEQIGGSYWVNYV